MIRETITIANMYKNFGYFLKNSHKIFSTIDDNNKKKKLDNLLGYTMKYKKNSIFIIDLNYKMIDFIKNNLENNNVLLIVDHHNKTDGEAYKCFKEVEKTLNIVNDLGAMNKELYSGEDKKNLKNKLIEFAESYNNTNDKIKRILDLFLTVSPYLPPNLKILKDEVLKKGFPKLKKNIISKIKTDELEKISFLDKEYFIKRMSDVASMFNKEEITYKYNNNDTLIQGKGLFFNIIELLKLICLKNHKGEYIDGVFTHINKSDADTYINKINELVNLIKPAENDYPSLKESMSETDKNYLKEIHKIKIEKKYEESIKELLDSIKKLSPIDINTKNLQELINFSVEMIKNKKLEIISEINRTENEILSKLLLIEPFKQITWSKTISVTGDQNILIQKDELLKYKVIELDFIAKQVLLTQLSALKMSDYVNISLNDNYKNVNNYINKGALFKEYFEISEILTKPVPDSAKPEEKATLLKEKEAAFGKFKTIIDNLNTFNDLFFKEIDNYLTDSSPNKCILSNEMNKVAYYVALFGILKKAGYQNVIDSLSASINGKIEDKKKAMEDIKKKYSDFLSTKIKIGKKYIYYNPNTFENKEDSIKDALKKTQDYIDNLIGIAKLLNIMHINMKQ